MAGFQEEIYSTKMKYDGIFSFKDYYKFCYDWLNEETGVDLSEKEYNEKITGNSKELKVKWEGEKKLTDYFKFVIKVEFHITNMSNVEINREGAKIKTNQGSVKTSVKGILVRDYEGKFETKPFDKFLRGIYEKWVITQRIQQFQDFVAGKCDGFLEQAKAYLDIEGRH